MSFRNFLKILTLVTVAVWAAVLVIPDRNLHVVFWDVGQGDAVLVWRGAAQMLIDGGPGNKVTNCLARHLPFWDKQIEVVVATHPDADHTGGLPSVFESYSVMQFVSVPVGAETTGYKKLIELIKLNKLIKVNNVYAGDEIKLGGVGAQVVWPTRQFVAENTETSKEGIAGIEGKESVLGVKAVHAETNDFSIGMIISFGDFDVLTTGDGDDETMEKQVSLGRMREVEVVKVPHHGSKYAAVPKWFESARPELAVISVGKNNYGHPAGELLSVLRDLDIRILRTDVEGDVEIVSDGKRWWVK